MSTATASSNMDPWMQDITVMNSTGGLSISSMEDLDFVRQWGIRLAINYATQIGATGVLLLVLLVLTRRDKRTSSIYIMNILCLTCNTIRSVLQCLFLTGNWFHPYASLTNEYLYIRPSDYANTIAANTMTLVTLICIMISLSLQVWVVNTTARPLQRLLVMSITSVFALAAVGCRFAVVVISAMVTLNKTGMGPQWGLLTATIITQAVAIWSYCAVFAFKLGYAIIQRKRLGMSQFGPMQIIFIMGCQTMIIPSIFAVLQFIPEESVPELGSQNLTITCIFLPLSAIWAGVVTDDSSLGGRGPGARQRLLRGDFGSQVEKKQNNMVSLSTFDSGKDPESPTTVRSPGNLNGDDICFGNTWAVEKGESSSRV